MVHHLDAWLTSLRGGRADMAALLLGAVAALALPPVHAVPVLLLAIPALLRLTDAAAGPRMAARRGFWFGFGLHVVGLYWITEPILLEAANFWWLVPFAVPLVAAVLALFVAAPVACCRVAAPGWPRALVLAGAWTLADLARQFVLTGFPWNPWGSVWAIPGRLGDVFIQPAALVGVHGLTAATLLLAAAPLFRPRGVILPAAGVLVLAWAGFGVLRLATPLPPAPGVAVVLVQGNVPEGEKWSQDRAVAIFDRYLALTEQGVAQAATQSPGSKPIVIWPETASPFRLQSDMAARAAVAQSAGPGALVLAGSVRFDGFGRPRNSLMAITGAGDPTAIYDKWHLVPFGEYQPKWFPLPIQIVPGGGFARGPGPQTLHVGAFPPAGALICYEAIFPAAVVDATDRPAWLVNVTNDAWFGNSSGPRQHLAAARLRAVEEGLPLMRAANTGISAAYDARGHELGRIGLNTTGTLIVALPGALPPTVFARFGLACPCVLALVLVAMGWPGLAKIHKIRGRFLPMFTFLRYALRIGRSG